MPVVPLPEVVTVDDEVVLRRWRPADARALSALIADNLEHLRGYMPWIAEEPKTLQQRRALLLDWEREWAEGSTTVHAVLVDGELAGSAGLHDRIPPDGLEIGYWISHRFLGRGLARRVSAALTSVAFDRPEVARVEIHHDETNELSRRVPEALGFAHVGEIVLERELAPAETGREHVWRVRREEWLSRPRGGGAG